MKENKSSLKSHLWLVISFLFIIVGINFLLPLLSLLGRSVEYEPFYKGFVEILGQSRTQIAFLNSLKTSLLASLLSITCALFFSYIVTFHTKGIVKKAFSFLAIIPMLVPSITHGIIIVYLFGKVGMITRIIGVQLPIYGQLGIIIGSFFYSFPIAFLILSQAFTNLDGRLFENATILGVSPFRRFFDIVLPIMKYAIFSAFAVCFTMIFTDYGIPLSVGGTYPILPILFYESVIGKLDFARGAIYSILILVPAAIVYFLEVLYFNKKQIGSSRDHKSVNLGKFNIIQKLTFIIFTIIILVPVTMTVLVPFFTNWPYDKSLTFAHFSKMIQTGELVKLIRNSVIMALGTSIIGTILTSLAGYVYIRTKDYGLLKKVTHGLYMLTLAIPGLALGLAYAMFFKGTFIYNTLFIMVLVNVFHFFGSPYMMVLSHFKLLNSSLEEICKTLGGNIFNIIFDVIIPNSKRMLVDVFVYLFINTMITISAISLLYNSQTITLSMKITSLNNQGMRESALAVSLVILIINIVFRVIQSFKFDKSSLATK